MIGGGDRGPPNTSRATATTGYTATARSLPSPAGHPTGQGQSTSPGLNRDRAEPGQQRPPASHTGKISPMRPAGGTGQKGQEVPFETSPAPSFFQTISTVPNGYSGRNTCSRIQLSASGKFLYILNQDHNSIAGFSVGPTNGRLTAVGQVPTKAVPNAFSLDTEGHFVFAAGSSTGRLALYRIDADTGQPTPLEKYDVGQPLWGC